MSSVLETDFPLVTPPITNPGASRISRQASRDSSGGRGSSLTRGFGINRNSGFGQSGGGSVSPAPEWQYEAVSTNSSLAGGSSGTRLNRIQTGFQAVPQRPLVIQASAPPQQPAVARPPVNLNRSSSLRKAYNEYADHSSEASCEIDSPGSSSEMQPLTDKRAAVDKPVVVQTSTHSSATSDYHSDISNSRSRQHQQSANQSSYPLALAPSTSHSDAQTRLLNNAQTYHTKVIRY